MGSDNVRLFHAPSGDDGKPLYTTPQERDLFVFDQGYELGYRPSFLYACQLAEAASVALDVAMAAESDRRRGRTR